MRLSGGLLRALVISAVAAHPAATGQNPPPQSSAVQRFLAQPDPSPRQVRALRHLEARNDHFNRGAWLDVWTESDDNGFHYQVVSEGGSGYIREHVLFATLKSESALRASGGWERATFTADNYIFEDRGVQADGLVCLFVKPRKKDVVYVEGSLFINPEDGELVRLEGRLSKSPSFWTHHVDIVRWFRRVGGYRMPVAVESVANVLIAGRSTFRMSYEYETVNGIRVGDPQPQRRTTELR